MQHQNHFVTVRRQRDTQRRRQNNAAIKFHRGKAVRARRFNLTVRNRANCPGENLGGVGAGVERQCQHRTVQAAAEERVQHLSAFYDLKRIHPRIEHQQLHVQRRTAKHVGEQPDRELDKFIVRHAANGKKHRQNTAHHHGGDQQPERNRHAGKAVAIRPQQRLPVFLNNLNHRSALFTPTE